MTERDPSAQPPLPVAQLHILMSLTGGDRHGYAIMREVELITQGAVRMGPGTLYGTVKKMLRSGLVKESGERPDPEMDDQRRRYYRITATGVRALDAEVGRMEQLARTARSMQARAARRPGA